MAATHQEKGESSRPHSERLGAGTIPTQIHTRLVGNQWSFQASSSSTIRATRRGS